MKKKFLISLLLLFVLQHSIQSQCGLPTPSCEEEKILTIPFSSFQFAEYTHRACEAIPFTGSNMPCSVPGASTLCEIIEQFGSAEPLAGRLNYALCLIIDIPACSVYEEYNWTGQNCEINLQVPTQVNANITIIYYESCGTCNTTLPASREGFVFEKTVFLDGEDPQVLTGIDLLYSESIPFDKCE